MLVPVGTAGEQLTPSEPCESGIPCFDLQPSAGETPRLNRPADRRAR
jgi:hypothetical protein